MFKKKKQLVLQSFCCYFFVKIWDKFSCFGDFKVKFMSLNANSDVNNNYKEVWTKVNYKSTYRKCCQKLIDICTNVLIFVITTFSLLCQSR